MDADGRVEDFCPARVVPDVAGIGAGLFRTAGILKLRCVLEGMAGFVVYFAAGREGAAGAGESRWEEGEEGEEGWEERGEMHVEQFGRGVKLFDCMLEFLL